MIQNLRILNFKFAKFSLFSHKIGLPKKTREKSTKMSKNADFLCVLGKKQFQVFSQAITASSRIGRELLIHCDDKLLKLRCFSDTKQAYVFFFNFQFFHTKIFTIHRAVSSLYLSSYSLTNEHFFT